MAGEMMTVAEVCEAANICRATLGRWVRMGLCPAPVKLGPRALRFRKSDIEGWLSSGGVRLHQSGVVPFQSAWLPAEDCMADEQTAADVASDETA